MAQTGHLIFIGRAHLLEKCRAAIDANISIQLVGEHGVGKSALARRISSSAIYLEHVTPAKDLLTALLKECYRRGWHDVETKDGEEMDDATLERALRKLDVKSSTAAALRALAEKRAVLVLDNFDEASATVVRLCRQIADVCTIVVCSTTPKPAQKPFLFALTSVTVPRLSAKESEQLVNRLLSEHEVAEREKKRVLRQLVESSQGLPSIIHETVKRAVGRGDLSLKSVRKEEMSGHRTIDMTPGLVVIAFVLVGLRVALRGSSDHDVTVILGAGGAVFMLFRFYATRLSRTNRR